MNKAVLAVALAIGVTTALLEPSAAAQRPSVARDAGGDAQFHQLYDFRGGTDGECSQGPLLLGPKGVIIGTLPYGGAYECQGGQNGCGAIFELKRNQKGYSESILYFFRGGQDGGQPTGSLALGPGRALYGTTMQGGGGGTCTIDGTLVYCGTVFELRRAFNGYAEHVLVSFTGANGSEPAGGLLGEGAKLYGTTQSGGQPGSTCGLGCGIVFKLRR